MIDFTCRIFLAVTRTSIARISGYLGWFEWFIGKQGWDLLRFTHAEGLGTLERGHANIHIHTNVHSRLREPWSKEQQSDTALKLYEAWGSELIRTHPWSEVNKLKHSSRYPEKSPCCYPSAGFPLGPAFQSLKLVLKWNKSGLMSGTWLDDCWSVSVNMQWSHLTESHSYRRTVQVGWDESLPEGHDVDLQSGLQTWTQTLRTEKTDILILCNCIKAYIYIRPQKWRRRDKCGKCCKLYKHLDLHPIHLLTITIHVKTLIKILEIYDPLFLQ